MTGIAGSGMCGLAALLLRRGAHVTGTDRNPSDTINRLRRDGAKIVLTQAADSVPNGAEVLVVSAAIPATHPEIVEAQRRGTPVTHQARRG